MKLALDIAKVGCIGCGCGDELDALAALRHLSECDDKSGDQEKSEKVKGRALACTAFFLRWGQRMTFDDLMDVQKADQSESVHQERPEFQATKFIKLLTMAAMVGDPFSMLHLGVCYEDGDCVSQDKQKAIELYQRAADMGDTNAMFNLAVWHENGGVSKDKEKTIELYQRAADMGDTNAMFNLAVWHENGGVSKDKEKTIELYQQASDMGNQNAMTNLAVCYKMEMVCHKTKRKPLNCIKKQLTWATKMQ